MSRIERARNVRDAILAVPRDQWEWKEVGGERHLEVHTSAWHASLRSQFSSDLSLPEPTTYLEAQILEQAVRPLPNVLDLWLPGNGKLLSIEYDVDEIRLISMKRGDWEADLFGLPPYNNGKKKP